MVLAYDLLEHRPTIDFITECKVFFPLCFKMAERFENLDNILLAWAKEKILKVLSMHLTVRRSRKRRKSRFSVSK